MPDERYHNAGRQRVAEGRLLPASLVTQPEANVLRGKVLDARRENGMVITQPAVDVWGYDFSGRRLVSEIRARARRVMSRRTSLDEAQITGLTAAEPSVPDETNSLETTSLLKQPSAPVLTPAPLDARERRARAAAVRGLMHARQCRFILAQEAFTEGLLMDTALDLVAIPTFWDMPRGGQEAAVRAYEQVGRIRDAATLAATIRRTFTPRTLPLRRPVSVAGPRVERD